MIKTRYPALILALFMAMWLRCQDSQNPCLNGHNYHIVVLGSSTAAGVGPGQSDSAWVNRYRDFLQSINPANQVTNLAQGGTTTYHIMPDWYAAPAGRPTRNTTRNVSEALRLQADAIIVNMPSNDAALGFSALEQMANFSTIVSAADSAGVPVWVCTTQPRNFASTAKIQVQREVRDSVLSRFGVRAIDFWTGFADTTGQLHPLFDSGDGVHMNDTAHGILYRRVRNKNILSAITDTFDQPDHFIIAVSQLQTGCGLANDSLWVRISNRGPSAAYDLPLRWRVEDMASGSVSLFYDTIRGGVGPCSDIRKAWSFSSLQGVNWRVSAHLETQNDSLLANDHSDTIQVQRSAPPVVKTADRIICPGDSVWHRASGGDSIIWLNVAGGLRAFGDSVLLGPLSRDDTLIARAVHGDLHFNSQLQTGESPNIDWNGIMFDLIASDTLVIDSLALRPSQASPAQVTARYRYGSYKGHENNPGSWNSWGWDSVQPVQAGDLATVRFGVLNLLPGDTLGVYLSMQSGASLKYRSANQQKIYSSQPLSLLSGTGVSHNFGATYSPRHWAGEVYFHHGFNPFGDCHRDTTIYIQLAKNMLDIGPDTSISYNQAFVIQLDPRYNSALWSTGDTALSLRVDSSLLDPGSSRLLLWVQVSDTSGCSFSDSLSVDFTSGMHIAADKVLKNLEIYPLPASDRLWITNPFSQQLNLSLGTLSGATLRKLRVFPGENQFTLSLEAGFYLLWYQDQKMAGRPILVKPR